MEEDFITHHEEPEEHPDERWLVSYADMMTLLFGLFVLLYSMAMDNKGKIDEVLKGVQITQAKNANPAPAEPLIDPQRFAELETMAEQKRRDLDLLRAQKLQDENDLRRLRDQTQAQSRTIAELQRSIASLSPPTPSQPQLAKTEKDLEQTRTQLEEANWQLHDLKQRLQSALKTSQASPTTSGDARALRSRVESLTATNDRQNEMIAKLKQDLEVRSRELAGSETLAEQARRREEELRRQQERLASQETEARRKDEENQKLRAKIKDLEAKTEDQGGSFLMFVVKWSTDKHDIDMTVTDPKGRSFDFRRRKFTNTPGEFTLDSRQGPGAEIWQADKFDPGVYTVTANLYQSYGNDNPAKVEASVVSSRRSLRLPAGQLGQGQKMTWRIRIAENGETTIL